MAMTRDQLSAYAQARARQGGDVFAVHCDIIIHLLDNCKITVPKENRFFISVNCGGILGGISAERAAAYRANVAAAGLSEGQEALAFTGDHDFSHTTAEWESVISLGIYGLKARLDSCGSEFCRRLSDVYAAALHFMRRAAATAAACGKKEMADGLIRLCEGQPRSMFEAMQTSLAYYCLQQMFDCTALRTLGRLDQLFYPYYKNERREDAEQLVRDYLREIDSLKVGANIPFALGGADMNGHSIINGLSYIFIDAYRSACMPDTKLHLLCAPDTPRDILETAFEGVRAGSNSIVFMSDSKITEGLEKLGERHEDAVNYHVVGCYECGGNGELTCSCNARVNIPKALELTLNGGRDMLTGKLIGLENSGGFHSFEALQFEFLRQLAHLCRCAMAATDIYEAHYDTMHASPILSATYTSALEKGADLYSGQGARYNNSSLNAVGLGTAVDSLAAIRKLVYDDRLMSIERLADILRADWAGEEPLRLLIRNRYPKYGTGDAATDLLARDTVRALASFVSGKPNAKGGVYRLGLFSIDWRWAFGKKTAASADGRRSGETLSQNTSATFGADREGATAHLISAAAIDASDTPNGAIVDIDLHSSAVNGKNGINALVSTLLAFFDMGGFAVHYNVLDTETLKAAKAAPEKYPTLQVRLCGWNVLFSALSEQEKDDFIQRSMRA